MHKCIKGRVHPKMKFEVINLLLFWRMIQRCFFCKAPEMFWGLRIFIRLFISMVGGNRWWLIFPFLGKLILNRTEVFILDEVSAVWVKRSRGYLANPQPFPVVFLLFSLQCSSTPCRDAQRGNFTGKKRTTALKRYLLLLTNWDSWTPFELNVFYIYICAQSTVYFPHFI